ncbi:MAG: GHMP family kinase ATP-binding protein [Acidimicrobiales bacterium]
MSGPLRLIQARAPVRICDNGGWTDTWFAGHGKVFNIAVAPCVEVTIEIHPGGSMPERVTVHGRTPLLDAAVAGATLPEDADVVIRVECEVPAGSATGTSAAVAVALLGALGRLHSPRTDRHEIARAAHRLEVETLGQESGVQDQLCAAYGGINFIEMDEYPEARVTSLEVRTEVRSELERRLVLVYLGRPHASSPMHERVIRHLAGEGPSSPRLERLRMAAVQARDAVLTGDLAALGRSMIVNTEAQTDLHPDLVSVDADRVIDVARSAGVLGWKVNGAGGDGGSMTLLSGAEAGTEDRLVSQVEAIDPAFRCIPIRLSGSGLRVSERSGGVRSQ